VVRDASNKKEAYMIIGHLLPFEAISRLDTNRLDELTRIAMNELAENPTIDDQIRQNATIMKALHSVVQRSLTPDELRK
jgi:hypothetical protein